MPTTDDYARIANVQPYGLPGFVQAYFGTEYPAGRGQQPQQASGWICAGCGRGYAPWKSSCDHCPGGAVLTNSATGGNAPEITDFDPDGT